VIALITIDVATGLMIHCEELTRMEQSDDSALLSCKNSCNEAPPLAVSLANSACADCALAPATSADTALTLQELEQLRAEFWADDVPIPHGLWSRQAASMYFESGGAAASPKRSPDPQVSWHAPIESKVSLDNPPCLFETPQWAQCATESSMIERTQSAVLSRNSTYEKELSQLVEEEASANAFMKDPGVDTKMLGLELRRCSSLPVSLMRGLGL